MSKTSKIVFFGNEKLATGISNVEPIVQSSIIKAGFEIEQVVTGPLSELKEHEAEIAVLVAYGHIIPNSILDQFPLGIINIHPSLLPLYRGSTPIEQAILDGAKKTGLSIMRLTSAMDEGPIYKQKTVHLKGNETKDGLTKSLQKLGSEMLIESLPEIINGTLKPRSQPHPDRATYTKKLSKSDGNIDWTRSAETIEREIRAYAGWPRSRINIGEVDCIITEVSVVNQQGPSGKYFVANKELVFNCGDKSISIHRLQPVGKKEMLVEEFLRGYINKI